MKRCSVRNCMGLALGFLSLLASACSGTGEYNEEELATESSELAVGTLHESEYLFQGQRLVAPNCYFRLEMQTDGNLVIYGGPGNAIWATHTNGPVYFGGHATLQTDNNFVLYSTGQTALFDTNTNGTLGNARLKMQDDGNLALYSDAVSGALWSSHTQRAPQAWPCNQVGRTEATQVLKGFDIPGGDLPGMPLRKTTPPAHLSWCGAECVKNASCQAFTFIEFPADRKGAQCWLKSAQLTTVAASGMVSGFRNRL